MSHIVSSAPKQFKSTVLIDDDEISNLIFSKFSEASKLTKDLICITNPLEGINYLSTLIKDDIPDVIFIDIDMPQMNGWDLIKKLKEDAKLIQTKIFVITSSIHPINKKKLKTESEVIGLIEKPFSIDKMIQLKQAYA